MKRWMGALAVLLALAAGTAAARETVPVVDYVGQSVTGAADEHRVRQAILAATQRRGWVVTQDAPGMLVAVLTIRNKHQLTVQATYTASQFSLTYRDSYNLKYWVRDGQRLIHPAYNTEVKALLDAINASLTGV